MQKIERNQLGSHLQSVQRERVIDMAKRLATRFEISPVQLPENGLSLIQWRDAVKQEAFYLGEIPIATAAISLSNRAGEQAMGGGIVMSDDTELAHAVAVLDAIWSHAWEGADEVEALAISGREVQESLRAQRQAILKRTRVNFSLLTEVDDEEEINHE